MTKIGFLEVPLRDDPGNSDSPLNVHLAQREPCRARQTEVQVSVDKVGEGNHAPKFSQGQDGLGCDHE